MEEIILNFIFKELEYQKEKLKCINLGYIKDEFIKIEIDLYACSQEYIEKLMKKKSIKKWE